jgi:cytochrome c biogenesis protein CcmG, thiol:disulfide interchange protein DsbE
VGIRFLNSRVSILTAIAITLVATGCDRGNHPSQINQPAPDFIVADGITSIHLADYRGKVVIVNFWESHCGPCILELPSLLQFHHEHADIPILSVSSDTDAGDYEKFIQQRHVDLLNVRDPKQSAGDKYGITGWPETFIIDRNGRIRRRFIGATDWNDPEIDHFLKTL